MSEDVQGQAAEASESSESSEATIAVHWREEGYIPPPPQFIGQANASDPAILDRFAEENFPECFREYADLLHCDEYYRTGDLLDDEVNADEAVEAARKEGQEGDKVLVWRRFAGQYSAKTLMVEGRDVFVDELLADHRGAVVEPVSMPAEAPLFLM